MTKLEIINETVEFYSADPKRRSYYVDENGDSKCYYNDRNGNHCAVGRCFIEKYHEMGVKLPKNSFPLVDLIKTNNVELDEMLQEPYRGHEISFWNSLQSLHDNPTNWNINGLSKMGKDFVNFLNKKYEK